MIFRFRWVFCQFEELEKCPPLRASIEKALKNLPRTLNETYERLLASIEGEDCQRIARNCLVWLAFSRRTFYLEELAEAAVLSEDFSEDFSKLQRLPDPHYIFELLGSLIVSSQTPVEVYGGEKGIDMTIQQRNTVTLAHFSIVDYLVSEEIRNSKAASFALDDISAEVFISKTCIRYLHGFDRSTSMQQKIICLEDKFVWDSQRKFIWEAQGFPLLDYACKYWAPHVKRIPFESQARVQEAVMRLFLSKSTLLCWIQTRKPRYPDRFRDITESDIYKFCQAPHEPYFHAAGMGLEYCVSQLLGSMDKVDLSKAIKAAINGTRSVNVVKILLNAGANAKGMAGVDLFIGTARHGSYSLVKTLLEGGANPHTPPEETALVLHDSVLNRDEKVVDLLLEAKVDVNHKDYQDRTPLHFAAAKSSTDLVRRLIVDYHIEVNARDRDGCTALHNAVGKGRTQMVRLLVEFADVNLQDNLGETPLHNAVWGGHAFITEILLEANADHTLRRNDGRTALELVRGPDAETIVQLLQVAADFSNGSSRR
jgi:ankyrin repeat domain-containing protein 50